MSFKAINKNDSTVYTLDEWERNLIHVTPYCPVCGEVTEIKAAGSTEVKTHFAHSIQGTDCPTINDNRRKYALLPPVDPDTENGNNLINWTKVNVWHLYTKCKEILHGRQAFPFIHTLLGIQSIKMVKKPLRTVISKLDMYTISCVIFSK